MTLEEYFRTEPRGSIIEMAEYLNVSRTWMSQLVNGHKKPSPLLAKTIEKATGGLVKKETLRPDIFLV